MMAPVPCTSDTVPIMMASLIARCSIVNHFSGMHIGHTISSNTNVPCKAFYASTQPCDVKTDNELLYELIPEFEKLCILKRGADGEIKLDIPALPFTEVTEYWNPACKAIRKELFDLLSDDLCRLWAKTRNCVPKHVDKAEYFVHAGAVRAYPKAQLLAIVHKELLPYPVIVGKTPLIYIAYRKKNV